MRAPLLAMICSAALAACGEQPSAAGPPSGKPTPAASAGPADAALLDFRTIRDIALASAPGEILSVELERHGSQRIYEFKILTKAGRVLELEIDARTGAILEREAE